MHRAKTSCLHSDSSKQLKAAGVMNQELRLLERKFTCFGVCCYSAAVQFGSYATSTNLLSSEYTSSAFCIFDFIVNLKLP